MRVGRSGILAGLAFAALPVPAVAQPVGSEFQVNTYTTGNQEASSVASDASGNFIVVWAGFAAQDGDAAGIFGQRYDSEGEGLGAEFRVNSFTLNSQHYPSVASAANGAFVVVWGSLEQDRSSNGVFGQRFDSEGVPQGGEFRVNSYTSGPQLHAAVASDADGNFVVVWEGNGETDNSVGIFGQRFNSEGVAQGGEFRVNSHTTFGQQRPSVASDASGNFVVVWRSYRQDGSHLGIFGQRFDREGVPQASEFQVNTYTTYAQEFPSVASDAEGNFVVVWESGLGIFGQRYDNAGRPQGGEFRVSMAQSANAPSVASDASGNFVVVWQGSSQADADAIVGLRYDSNGVPQGSEFQVNTHRMGAQLRPAAATDASESLIAVWHSQDASGFGIFGQRFNFGGTATMHAADLDRRAKNVAANWRAQVKTLVHDDSHGALSGVLVTLDVSGVGTRTCTTTAAGQCEVSVVVSDSVPSLTFAVTNLSKAGFSYDAGENHDPDGDSDGTLIVVNQP